MSDSTPTTNQLSEQSQNPSQAGTASTSISKDVGDAPEGKDLKDRMEKIDSAGGTGEAVKVGSGEDEHEKAAQRQP